MTFVSFKKMLRFKHKKPQQQVQAIKDASSFETDDSSSVEEQNEEPVVVQYSSVPVETHLNDQPSGTELVLTTTTTTSKEQELPPEGMMDICTKVQFLQEQEPEIILNTKDLSRCTSVLIEQAGNKPSETEMVLTMARMKTIAEQEEVPQDEAQEDSIPNVIPASEDDLIVVLTDNQENQQEQVKEQEEAKQEEDTVFDNVSVSLQSYMALPKAPKQVANLSTTPTTPPLDDSSILADNVSVSLQSYQNVVTQKEKEKEIPTFVYGQSARPATPPRTFAAVFASHRGGGGGRNTTTGSTALSHIPREETKQEEEDNYSTVSKWGRQLDPDADEQWANQVEDFLSALLPAATALSEQHDVLVQYLHGVATGMPIQQKEPKYSIVDEDDVTASLVGGGDMSTVMTTAPEQDPLALLHDLIEYGDAFAPSLPNMDRELVLLARTLDPSQLGQLVANNRWLQAKAHEKAGLQKQEFRQIMSDLLFL